MNDLYLRDVYCIYNDKNSREKFNFNTWPSWSICHAHDKGLFPINLEFLGYNKKYKN